MAPISYFITAYLKIQDSGQTIELKRTYSEHMNLKSYASETFVLHDHYEFLYILYYYCYM